jgi:OmpR-family two-component system manganese-sensing sensor histidine kinase
LFNRIRYRLLWSYLAVITGILLVFAIALRATFTYRLNQQLMARLETLARAAAREMEIDAGELVVDQTNLTNEQQAIQWFDIDGNLLADQGDLFLHSPFQPDQIIQQETAPQPLRGLTIPVHDYNTGTFIGYTRVSESTADLQNILKTLDWGIGGGILAALALSSAGGLWLTRQAMQPVEHSFQKLQQFTSDAAHELRSPLMAIQTNAAVALKYPEGIRDSDATKFQAIKSASTQLTSLTEDLLFLARTSDTNMAGVKITSSIPKRAKRIDLNTILQDLIQLYQPRAKANQIALIYRPSNAPLIILGQSTQLTRLFSNLIDNALRYTPSRGTVTVISAIEKSLVTIAVQDTGIGISPEHLDLIFERFWQAESSRHYQNAGFGLGLAIAHSVVQNHGGKIAVSSELNQGSCFTVYLPNPL